LIVTKSEFPDYLVDPNKPYEEYGTEEDLEEDEEPDVVTPYTPYSENITPREVEKPEELYENSNYTVTPSQKDDLLLAMLIKSMR
tara:strand:- start:252 stop:506 length:255 start_codon:yes stop_codon:yes gene_type:complete